MAEFRKLDFASKPIEAPREQSMGVSRKKFGLKSKTLVVLLIVLVLFGFVSFFTIVLPAQRVYSSAKLTYTQAKKVLDAIKTQNVAVAGDELVKTQQSLKKTQEDLHQLAYLKYIPLVSNYYNDADHLTNAGSHGLVAGGIFIDSVKPYADVLGLKGQGSFVMGSAEQRIQTAILTMGKITPRIDDIAKELEAVQKEVDGVDPNHYPSLFGGDKIRTQLTTLRTLTDEGVTFVNEARPLIKVLPSLLGESKEKKYLILFQNDKELRPTGGFITAYAVFRIDRGIIHVDRSDDIYTLDNSIRTVHKAPEPILAYLPKVKTLNLRDSNLSPDFVESMKTFNTLYKDASGKVDVDGIIALDTHVLVSVIKILDDEVVASGIKFTTKIDKRCDCPQVIYELEDNISRPVNYVKTGRKDLLGSLLYAIMQKALKSSPKLYWGPLFQDMVKEVNEKHVLAYIYNTDAQSGIESLNAAGRIKTVEGDYLHINDANFAGAKTNLYIKQTVDEKYQVAGDGTITKTVVINYKNPHPASDCNLERGGLCLNAIHRDWFRVYVPKGSKLVSSEGSEVKVKTYEELGKTVFDGFLTLRPQGAATLTLTYTLPFKLASGSPLPLLIQKQPGTDNNYYTISINGKTKDKFELLVDKELKLSL